MFSAYTFEIKKKLKFNIYTKKGLRKKTFLEKKFLTLKNQKRTSQTYQFFKLKALQLLIN